jgi:hypothetical protein
MSQATSLITYSLGGAVGALLIRSAFRSVGALWAYCRPLATYECANPVVGPGNMHHGWGRRVDEPLLPRTKQAWEHTSTQLVPNREHTIYGPYTNDFGRPGYYRVRFRVFGSGFPPTNDPIVCLDVVQAPFADDRQLRIIGQRIIRAKELSPKYRGFDVYCYAAGTSVYEYRCSVVPGVFRDAACTLRFDRIRVYVHLPLWDIF